MSQARCRNIANPEVFFPVSDETLYRSINIPAKAICAWCPVRYDCLRYALLNDELFGVWGGLSRYERTQLVNRHRAAKEEAEEADTPEPPASSSSREAGGSV